MQSGHQQRPSDIRIHHRPSACAAPHAKLLFLHRVGYPGEDDALDTQSLGHGKTVETNLDSEPHLGDLTGAEKNVAVETSLARDLGSDDLSQVREESSSPKDADCHIRFIADNGIDQFADMPGCQTRKIGIDEKEDVCFGGLDSRQQRAALAPVLVKAYGLNAGMLNGDFVSVVLGAIADNDNLIQLGGFYEWGKNSWQACSLVIGGNDGGYMQQELPLGRIGVKRSITCYVRNKTDSKPG